MFIFLVTVALLVAAQAVPQIEQRFPYGRIVGGENAVIETYPYQISLEIKGRHSCGGSIISANYVVTAGLCVHSSASDMTVRAGSSLKGQGGSVHQVEEVVLHEKYTTNLIGIPSNDIAVLKLKDPISFDESRQPINLFEQDEESVPGTTAVVTGWGRTRSGSPVQLQTVSIPIITKELCDQAYAAYGGLPEGQICAAYYGTGGKDSCQGDAGGPLAINGRLAGIVSWGNGCGEPFFPGAYTEVAAYRDWINEHAQL